MVSGGELFCLRRFQEVTSPAFPGDMAIASTRLAIEIAVRLERNVGIVFMRNHLRESTRRIQREIARQGRLTVTLADPPVDHRNAEYPLEKEPGHCRFVGGARTDTGQSRDRQPTTVQLNCAAPMPGSGCR